MATTTNFSVRMDGDIKKQCEALYGELGINLTTAIMYFYGNRSGSEASPLMSGWTSRTRKRLPLCWKRSASPEILP